MSAHGGSLAICAVRILSQCTVALASTTFLCLDGAQPSQETEPVWLSRSGRRAMWPECATQNRGRSRAVLPVVIGHRADGPFAGLHSDHPSTRPLPLCAWSSSGPHRRVGSSASLGTQGVGDEEGVNLGQGHPLFGVPRPGG